MLSSRIVKTLGIVFLFPDVIVGSLGDLILLTLQEVKQIKIRWKCVGFGWLTHYSKAVGEIKGHIGFELT